MLVDTSSDIFLWTKTYILSEIFPLPSVEMSWGDSYMLPPEGPTGSHLLAGSRCIFRNRRLPAGRLFQSVNTFFFLLRDAQKKAASLHRLGLLWGKWTCFFSAATVRLSESVSGCAVAERCLQPQGFSIRLHSAVLQARPTEGPSWLKLYTDWFTQSGSRRLHNSWNCSVTQPPFWCQVKRGWTWVSQSQLTWGSRTRHLLNNLLCLVGFPAFGEELQRLPSQTCTEVYLPSSLPYSVNHQASSGTRHLAPSPGEKCLMALFFLGVAADSQTWMKFFNLWNNWRWPACRSAYNWAQLSFQSSHQRFSKCHSGSWFTRLRWPRRDLGGLKMIHLHKQKARLHSGRHVAWWWSILVYERGTTLLLCAGRV